MFFYLESIFVNESICLLMIFRVSQITENVLPIFKINQTPKKKSIFQNLKKEKEKKKPFYRKNCLLKQIEFQKYKSSPQSI